MISLVTSLLCPRSSFDFLTIAINREQAGLRRFLGHGLEEDLRDVALEEAVSVLGEDGDVPDPVIHGEVDKPAEQEVVIQLLHELPLAPHAVEGLQQERSEELLRRDRGAAGAGS